jgi:hypothetical protein
MKLRLKRDETSTSNPDPAQLEVGELVMNSVTGKLYTKLVDGSLIEFIGQKVCYGPIPTILFSNVTNFCCYGDILSVSVDNLAPSPKDYTFEFEELTGNNSVISISNPIYTNYTVSDTNGVPAGQTVTLRKAEIPVNINIADPQSINIFKFVIYSDNIMVTEKTLAIQCDTCN